MVIAVSDGWYGTVRQHKLCATVVFFFLSKFFLLYLRDVLIITMKSILSFLLLYFAPVNIIETSDTVSQSNKPVLQFINYYFFFQTGKQ